MSLLFHDAIHFSTEGATASHKALLGAAGATGTGRGAGTGAAAATGVAKVGLGNVLGSTLLAYYWDDLAQPLATSWDKVNLLSSFGDKGGLLVTYLLLALSFAATLLWEKRFFARKAKRDEQLIAEAA